MVIPVTGFEVWEVAASVANVHAGFPTWWAGPLAGLLAATGSTMFCLLGLLDQDGPLAALAGFLMLAPHGAGIACWIAAAHPPGMHDIAPQLWWTLIPVVGASISGWWTMSVYEELNRGWTAQFD